MDLDQRRQMMKHAQEWIYEAGQNIRNKINEPLEIHTKSSANDLVTSVDQATERFFVEKIKSHYPDHLLFGEEGYGDEITSLEGTIWIIDPIDGTTNFVHQKRNFAISIGVYHDGKGEIGLVYDVMGDKLYHAMKDSGAYKNNEKLALLKSSVNLETSLLSLNHFWLCENKLVDEKVMQDLIKRVRGVRSSGSAALDIASVAEGVLDGYLALGLSPWDIAGGMILMNEVGGLTTNHLGKQIDMLTRNSLLACNPHIQDDLIRKFLLKGKK